MTQDFSELVERYMEVCNQAIEKHKDTFPYKNILKASEAFQGSGWRFTVYDDEPKGSYQINLNDNFMEAKPCEKKHSSGWHLNTSYLHKVTQNPQDYIDNPALLDLDWLKNRMGL